MIIYICTGIVARTLLPRSSKNILNRVNVSRFCFQIKKNCIFLKLLFCLTPFAKCRHLVWWQGGRDVFFVSEYMFSNFFQLFIYIFFHLYTTHFTLPTRSRTCSKRKKSLICAIRIDPSSPRSAFSLKRVFTSRSYHIHSHRCIYMYMYVQ